MTPDAQRSAIPTTTFIIIFFQTAALPGLAQAVAIIIPPMIIKTKDIIRINVTNILVKLHIKTGKAVAQVTLVSPGPGAEVPSSIHLPIKGIEVLSDIPQQTPSAEQDLHSSLTFFVPVGQLHHELGLTPGAQSVSEETTGSIGSTGSGSTGFALQIQHWVPPPQSCVPIQVCHKLLHLAGGVEYSQVYVFHGTVGAVLVQVGHASTTDIFPNHKKTRVNKLMRRKYFFIETMKRLKYALCLMRDV